MLLSNSSLSKVRVSREAIESPGPGYEYRITFLGAGVMGNVPQLAVGSRGIDGSDNCTAFRVQDGHRNRTTVSLAFCLSVLSFFMLQLVFAFTSCRRLTCP